MTNYIQESLNERGLDLAMATTDHFDDAGSAPDSGREEAGAGAMTVFEEDDDAPERSSGPEPKVRTHNPISIDCVTIDSYQGQEKDLVFFFSTVSASSGPKFVANANRLCVAFTRMRQGLVVVGDLGPRTDRQLEVNEGGQHLDTRAFNKLWA